jgi:hypothetical protein
MNWNENVDPKYVVGYFSETGGNDYEICISVADSGIF